MEQVEKLSSHIGKSVGMGILSWRSHATLEKSLQSYEAIGLKDLFDEVKIIFQEISDEDIALAKKYGYDYVGTERNLGIQQGHQLIHDNITADYLLVLENDNPVVADAQTTYQRLLQALGFLENGTVDMMRLRHRWYFGEGFSLEKYTRYYDIRQPHRSYNGDLVQQSSLQSVFKGLRRLFRPKKAQKLIGYALYFEKEPQRLFPEFVESIGDECFAVSSRVMTWTNQSVLLQRSLYGSLLSYAWAHPSGRTANGFPDLEKPLNTKWWRDQDYRIGVCEGIFTHNRYDDSWRREHHAFNQKIVKTSKGRT